MVTIGDVVRVVMWGLGWTGPQLTQVHFRTKECANTIHVQIQIRVGSKLAFLVKAVRTWFFFDSV